MPAKINATLHYPYSFHLNFSVLTYIIIYLVFCFISSIELNLKF